MFCFSLLLSLLLQYRTHSLEYGRFSHHTNEMVETDTSTHAHTKKRENIYSANALIYYINMKLCFAIHQAHFDEEEEEEERH